MAGRMPLPEPGGRIPLPLRATIRVPLDPEDGRDPLPPGGLVPQPQFYGAVMAVYLVPVSDGLLDINARAATVTILKLHEAGLPSGLRARKETLPSRQTPL